MAALSHRAQDIYPSLMLTQGHGYPLWYPRPPSNFPPDYVRRGTQIGDLGYLDAGGGFIYLFNVYKDAEDPVNLKRVPPGFVPLKSAPGVREELGFHEKNLVIAIFKSMSSSTRGVVLVLPDGADRYDSENPGLLGEYAAANAHSWYQHLNGQGREIYNGTLYLVTGCDKSRSWATQCYVQTSTPSKFTLSGVFRPREELLRTSTGTGRSHKRDMTPGAMANQTIFLRGYSISVRTRPALRVLGIKKDTTIMRILALLRTVRDEIPYRNRSNPETQQFPEVGPAVSVNNYILDSYYGATVALTHDHYMGMINKVQNPMKAVELMDDFISDDGLVFIARSSGTGGAWIANRGFTGILGNRCRTLNSTDAETLQKLTGCTPEEAKNIIGLRPRPPVRARLTRWYSGMVGKKKLTIVRKGFTPSMANWPIFAESASAEHPADTSYSTQPNVFLDSNRCQYQFKNRRSIQATG
ncbi:uncharacterized protein ARMOST_12349 [Armillaria ostoyae]|uniref:Uncharacterized protein n=1 Tax=Armillaria ostoyae TaxID=47428 RepID=A0A284RJN9_ARMOS|nr:uncharacterized protein ARMOST_12349 [Armillaria ostoyae]